MMTHLLKEFRHMAAPVARRAAGFLVRQYASNPLIRRWYASIRDISSRSLYPISPKLHELLFVKLKLYLRKQYLHRDYSSSIFTPESLYCANKSVSADFNPKVSVIVPSYNHARFLPQRLDSIYKQTYMNLEVILLDDASTDESQVILEEYRQRFPEITRYELSKTNSGGVFHQWKRGLEMATGDLVWVAESDDYCSENLVTELVKYFVNEAVMLAYCRTTFVEKESTDPIWSLEEYLAELDHGLWRSAFVMSAHRLVNKAWAIKNIIPNVSSAIFRHPGKLSLLQDEKWKRMRICGDWIFYLHLVRGGLVAYTPAATNYYRLHQTNTSVNTYSQDIYYQEHEHVSTEIVALYRVDESVFERKRQLLQSHWRKFRMDYSDESFIKCYDYERIRPFLLKRKPNLLMVSYALAAGGGEIFPVKLANMLKKAGYGITFFNCGQAPTEPGVREMLQVDIPLLELDSLDKLSSVMGDMGIELVHSHHGWVDVNVCALLEYEHDIKLIVTTHGMYETIPSAELIQILPLLQKRVNRFVYIAEKNLMPFSSNSFDMTRFTKIGNASDTATVSPISRRDLNVPEDAFLVCLVSRAIPEKGWQEAIEAVKLARKLSHRDIHLLLIGSGPEYERLGRMRNDEHVHLLGFRPNTRDYFAASDLGILPSRFAGESFPIVLIDCFFANRPVLASNIGEIKNMISTSCGFAGTLFDLNNWQVPVQTVAEAIAAYAGNRNLYLEHMRRVPEAAAKFDPTVLLKNYETVYLQLHKNRKDQPLARQFALH